MEMPFRTGIIYVIMGMRWERGNGELEWNSVRQSSEISVGFRFFFFLIYLWSVNAGGIARQGPARLGPALRKQLSGLRYREALRDGAVS